MAVDWNAMWPYIAGGFIISLAISINVALTKRMISLSTIFHDLLSPERPEFTWKAGILGGLIFTSALLWNINGYGEIKNTNIVPFEAQSSFFSGLGIYGFMFAGLLVGVGTRIAGGGITGHAFCGIPRLSLKSIIAVIVFMGTAFLVATMKNKSAVLTDNGMSCASLDVSPSVTANIFLAASAILFVYSLFKNPDRHNIISTVVSFGAGAALALGLIVSGMAQRTRFLEFLTFKDSWNSSFIFVFVCAIVGNLITFNLFLRHKFDGHMKQPHIFNVIIGSILFGGGLGLSGMTPGTALVVAPVYFPEVLVFFLLPAAFGHTLAGYVNKVSEAVRGAAEADDLYGQF